MRRSTKIGLAASGAILMTGGIAVAAWLTSGTGSGTAQAGTLTPLTVVAGTAPVADLFPGSTGGDVYVSVTNPNTFPVTVTNATIGAGSITPANCAVTVNAGPFSVSVASIAAGATVDVVVQDALSMGTNSDTSCQGAVISVPAVTVNAQVGN